MVSAGCARTIPESSGVKIPITLTRAGLAAALNRQRPGFTPHTALILVTSGLRHRDTKWRAMVWTG
jgi:hypothetical protein